jgi:hypothetical protein
VLPLFILKYENHSHSNELPPASDGLIAFKLHVCQLVIVSLDVIEYKSDANTHVKALPLRAGRFHSSIVASIFQLAFSL